MRVFLSLWGGNGVFKDLCFTKCTLECIFFHRSIHLTQSNGLWLSEKVIARISTVFLRDSLATPGITEFDEIVQSVQTCMHYVIAVPVGLVAVAVGLILFQPKQQREFLS
jgi:hypothetical protein